MSALSVEPVDELARAVHADVDALHRLALRHPPQELPAGAMIYSLPSRYCQSDLLARMAQDEFRHFGRGGCRHRRPLLVRLVQSRRPQSRLRRRHPLMRASR